MIVECEALYNDALAPPPMYLLPEFLFLIVIRKSNKQTGFFCYLTKG